MSQKTKEGFVPTMLPISAGSPLGSSPEAAAKPFKRSSVALAPLRCLRPPVVSATVGVGHTEPVETLTLLWRVNGLSREIDRPAGVADTVQISGDSIEPSIPSRSRNLLSHDDRGPEGAEEAEKVGP